MTVVFTVYKLADYNSFTLTRNDGWSWELVSYQVNGNGAGYDASLNKELQELPASALRPGSVGSHLATSQYLLNLMSGINSEPPFVQSPLLPEKFALYQNYPNPFNPATTIRFDLPELSQVKLEIYNIKGQRVNSLIDKVMNAGSHHFLWQTEEKIASGIYFCRFEAKSMQTSEHFIAVRRLLLLK